VDRDAAGWRVVDFKTSRGAVTEAEAASHRQLGLYQLALSAGGLSAPNRAETGLSSAQSENGTGPAAEVSGAALVFLRLDGPGGAKTMLQPSLAESPWLEREPQFLGLTEAGAVRVGSQRDYPTWVHHGLAACAQLLTEGRFPAVAQQSCRWCAFHAGCPAVEEGEE